MYVKVYSHSDLRIWSISFKPKNVLIGVQASVRTSNISAGFPVLTVMSWIGLTDRVCADISQISVANGDSEPM